MITDFLSKKKTQEKKLKRKRRKQEKNWTKKFLQRDGKAPCFEEEKVDKEQIQKDIQEEFSPAKFLNTKITRKENRRWLWKRKRLKKRDLEKMVFFLNKKQK